MRFDKQEKVISQAMAEIRKELIEDIRNVLYRISRYKKYQGKLIRFSSSMGMFSLIIEGNGGYNHFGLITRLIEIVDRFGNWHDYKSMTFYSCEAIPDGIIEIIGGGAKFEGELS